MSKATGLKETHQGYLPCRMNAMPNNKKKELVLKLLVQFKSNQPTTSYIEANGTIKFSNEVDLTVDVECCELNYDAANTPGSTTFASLDSDGNISNDVTKDIITENSANCSQQQRFCQMMNQCLMITQLSSI